LVDNIKKNVLGGEFGRNVLTLVTGTTIAQAIPVAISPILTRMYSPEDFGVLAVFTSITAIFGSIANGRYEMAIVLPVEDEDAINLTALAILIALGLSIALLFVAIIFNGPLVGLIGNKEISSWLYFIPLAVFLIGLFNALNYFHTRIKNFKDISKATVYQAITGAFIQLGLGFLKTGAGGLISGQILSRFAGNTTLGLKLLSDKVLLRSINRKDMKRLAQRYSNFPKFSMWGVLVNTLSYNSTNIFIAAIYSTTTLGFFSMGNRVLGMPSSLIGQSVGRVFFQKATEEKNQTGKAVNTFNKTFKGLLIMVVPGFTILFFIVEPLFTFVFGEEWRIAGQYAKIMMPLFFIRFMVSPLSIITNVFEKQVVSLVWQISLLAATIVTFIISFKSNFETIIFLYLFSVALFILYALLFFIVLRISRGE